MMTGLESPDFSADFFCSEVSSMRVLQMVCVLISLISLFFPPCTPQSSPPRTSQPASSARCTLLKNFTSSESWSSQVGRWGSSALWPAASSTMPRAGSPDPLSAKWQVNTSDKTNTWTFALLPALVLCYPCTTPALPLHYPCTSAVCYPCTTPALPLHYPCTTPALPLH